ncbi:MAG: AraC family transcriptional regulator ligand-binding domain-containing protein [Saprospiraceae bacterium]
MTFGARYIANIIQFAKQQGANQKDLLQLTGLTMNELNDETLRLEVSTYNAVLENALKQTKDKFFGLHIGEYLSLSAAGLIVQIAQSSETVRQAVDFMIQFSNLGCQALPFSLHEHDDEIELRITPSDLWQTQSPESVQHTVDGIVVFTIKELHTLTHQKHYPTKLLFHYKQPNQIEEYQRIFKCAVDFNYQYTSLFFSNRLFQEKIITSDYNLLKILVQHAEFKLATMEQQSGFSTIVKQTILNLVKPEFPTIEQVAANLNLSVRTLQRRLKSEQKTYKSVLDNLKQQFAMDYIKNPQLTVSEIAYLLDYSEVSAFSRSFKRWTGKTPNQFRNT